MCSRIRLILITLTKRTRPRISTKHIRAIMNVCSRDARQQFAVCCAALNVTVTGVSSKYYNCNVALISRAETRSVCGSESLEMAHVPHNQNTCNILPHLVYLHSKSTNAQKLWTPSYFANLINPALIQREKRTHATLSHVTITV